MEYYLSLLFSTFPQHSSEETKIILLLFIPPTEVQHLSIPPEILKNKTINTRKTKPPDSLIHIGDL